jgi:hypothetical protein
LSNPVPNTKNFYAVRNSESDGKPHLKEVSYTALWEYNIRMEFGKVGWVILDWIHVAQDRN